MERLMELQNTILLDVQLCQERAKECRALLLTTEVRRARVMLEHVAGTWERIAESLTGR
jgi:hypothetical protein